MPPAAWLHGVRHRPLRRRAQRGAAALRAARRHLQRPAEDDHLHSSDRERTDRQVETADGRSDEKNRWSPAGLTACLQVRSTSVRGGGTCTACLCTGCLTASRKASVRTRAGTPWSAGQGRPLARTRRPPRPAAGRTVSRAASPLPRHLPVWDGLHRCCRCSVSPERPSLLGVSHISVNASMTINDTAITNGTVSRPDEPDPIDSLDVTVCPADDVLDGCKVSVHPSYSQCHSVPLPGEKSQTTTSLR